VKTVYSTVYPAETTDYASIAQRIIASHAQVDVMGTFLPDISAFVQAFHQQHYDPQLLVATAGPDQANDFIKAVGLKDTEGIMVPNTWFPQLQTYQNGAMVQEYVAKYGGTINEVSSDVAQAYSVGQVVFQAVQVIHSLNNAALIKQLHAGVFNTTQGPVRFDASGQNSKGLAYLFQWQNGHIVPIYPTDIQGVKIQNAEFPKPAWA
jgi:branched-chain amino acid transport system substrate-binding protein